MTRARDNADGARLDAPLASPTFTGTPTTPIIKLTPTATSSAPTGSEGALYYDSDKDALMKFTGDNEWRGVHPVFMEAKGPDGAEGTVDGLYKYHIFNATKTGSNAFSVTRLADDSANNAVEFLVIAGGGGGGAGASGSGGSVPSGGSPTYGGNGGSGMSSTMSGSSTTYGGGGGGGANQHYGPYGNTAIGGTGGTGGGGNGADADYNPNTTNNAGAGTANLGGGGGGAARAIGNQATANQGGSGVVIVRYQYQ